jgi:hypothetical protein
VANPHGVAGSHLLKRIILAWRILSF